MAQLITIARPYADAAFANAKEANKLTERSQELVNLATIAADASMQALIANPSSSVKDIMGVFTSVMDGSLSKEGQNLLIVMAENKRLVVLPEVSALFEDLKAEDEKRVRATIFSARKLTVEQNKKLKTALNAKFDAEVEMTTEIDASLISGIKIIVGDWAIDGSAAAQLNKLGAVIAQ
jgi:F-type H+-transporting ATPase subunit delta